MDHSTQKTNMSTFHRTQKPYFSSIPAGRNRRPPLTGMKGLGLNMITWYLWLVTNTSNMKRFCWKRFSNYISNYIRTTCNLCQLLAANVVFTSTSWCRWCHVGGAILFRSKFRSRHTWPGMARLLIARRKLRNYLNVLSRPPFSALSLPHSIAMLLKLLRIFLVFSFRSAFPFSLFL